MNDLQELVAERLHQDIPVVVERDDIMEPLPRPARFNRVQIICGMRRSGKTFYLFQLMNHLLEDGLPKKLLFYFDFSDDRLPTTEPRLMDAVLEEYWRQVPETRSQGCYLFLDEVQDCPNWQGTCRRIAENETVTLCITGSSSKVSSEGIATDFRGRSHVHEMLPCSFGEFLRFHEELLPRGTTAESCIEDVREDAVPPQERTALEALFDRYLVIGGFPGIQKDTPAARLEVLQGYVRDVVSRDVADRMSIGPALAHQAALFVLRNTSCETSVNSVKEALQEGGGSIGWETTSQMIQLLEQAYLFFEVHEYSKGMLPNRRNPPKFYAVDPGLAFSVSRASQEDAGKRLETAAFLELKRRMAGRRADSISSWTETGKRGRKVDFLVGESFAGEGTASDPYLLLQVSLSLASEKTRRREIASLDAAFEATGLPEGTIVTLREEEDCLSEHGKVHIVPAWKWFLSRQNAS